MLVVVVAVAAVIGDDILHRATTRKVTAYFSNTVGLYEGDTVRVLGVRVGSIDKITPQGTRVAVEMNYRSSVRIPQNAQAAIIAPTLVTGRYVQFSPVYTGGPELADGGIVPEDRTAVPVPYDEIKTQLATLAEKLGPQGLNKQGTLTRFVNNTADALDGTGSTINGSISEVSKLADTLDKGGPDLFASVRNLASFVDALSANNDQIAGFNRQLDGVAGVLAGNRTELGALLRTLSDALVTIERVVRDNRGRLAGDVASLQKITGLLKEREDTLAQILHSGPTALSDFYNIYDPSSNSLTGNAAIPDIPDPKSLICALLTTVNAPQRQCVAASASFTQELTRQMSQRQPTSLAAAQGFFGLLDPTSATSSGRGVPGGTARNGRSPGGVTPNVLGPR